MNHKSPDRSSHGIIKHSRNLMVVLCLGMLAGILIWAKLRLVTDIPRSAYADPREVEIPEQETGDSAAQSDQLDEQSPIDDSEPDPKSDTESISDLDAEQLGIP